MLHVISTNCKLFSWRPNSPAVVVTVIATVPKALKTHMFGVAKLQAEQ